MTDHLTTKRCSTCQKDKPLTEFSKAKAYRDGYRGQCKACVYEKEKLRQRKPEYRERQRAWEQQREVSRHRIVRKQKEASQPQISPQQISMILEAQDYKCAICTAKHGAAHRELLLDYNYRTKQVRGMICSTCYTSMCQFGDDRHGLKRVIDYLDRYDNSSED